jgi:ferredoxin
MPRVEFVRSGKVVEWDGTAPALLDFAEANGIAIDSCCRCGVDGVCQTRLLSGQVRYVEEPCHQVEAGCVLPCICVPTTDVCLDA